jgi:dethiobiotin synthetase
MDISSIFVGGTGTGVGKTHVAAGLVRMLRGMDMNVGVMKPYSAGQHDGTGISLDARILADAAGILATPEINPHHQTLEAPPYTGSGTAALHPMRMVERYHRLAVGRDVMVVEGMGGLLVPILPDYFMADLARDMGLRTLVVADNAVGTIHHTVSTLLACRHRGTEASGIVLNMIRDGYDRDLLQGMLRGVTDTPVLATLARSDRPGRLNDGDAGALLGI